MNELDLAKPNNLDKICPIHKLIVFLVMTTINKYEEPCQALTIGPVASFFNKNRFSDVEYRTLDLIKNWFSKPRHKNQFSKFETDNDLSDYIKKFTKDGTNNIDPKYQKYFKAIGFKKVSYEDDILKQMKKILFGSKSSVSENELKVQYGAFLNVINREIDRRDKGVKDNYKEKRFSINGDEYVIEPKKIIDDSTFNDAKAIEMKKKFEGKSDAEILDEFRKDVNRAKSFFDLEDVFLYYTSARGCDMMNGFLAGDLSFVKDVELGWGQSSKITPMQLVEIIKDVAEAKKFFDVINEDTTLYRGMGVAKLFRFCNLEDFDEEQKRMKQYMRIIEKCRNNREEVNVLESRINFLKWSSGEYKKKLELIDVIISDNEITELENNLKSDESYLSNLERECNKTKIEFEKVAEEFRKNKNNVEVKFNTPKEMAAHIQNLKQEENEVKREFDKIEEEYNKLSQSKPECDEAKVRYDEAKAKYEEVLLKRQFYDNKMRFTKCASKICRGNEIKIINIENEILQLRDSLLKETTFLDKKTLEECKSLSSKDAISRIREEALKLRKEMVENFIKKYCGVEKVVEKQQYTFNKAIFYKHKGLISFSDEKYVAEEHANGGGRIIDFPVVLTVEVKAGTAYGKNFHKALGDDDENKEIVLRQGTVIKLNKLSYISGQLYVEGELI